MSNRIGIDLGMGAIKLWNKTRGIVLPSFIAPTGGTVYAAVAGANKQQIAPTVEFGGYAYYVGPHAHHYGRVITNLSFSKLTDGPHIKALLYGALSLLPKRHSGATAVAAALPVDMMTLETAKDSTAAVRSWLLGKHEWSYNGSMHSIEVTSAVVTTQPVGAMMDFRLTDAGKSANALDGKTGVISIGFNTLELLGVADGAVVPALTSGEKLGVRRYMQLLHPRATHAELDRYVRDGRVDDGALGNWAGEVIGQIEETWNDTAFANVIAVGGGTILLRKQLEQHFGKVLYIPKDPVLSIARGLHKMVR